MVLPLGLRSTDIFDFQLIAKAGAKYKEAYHLVDGVKKPVQKVNRVYATSDERYGKLFKVKAENDATASSQSPPSSRTRKAGQRPLSALTA